MYGTLIQTQTLANSTTNLVTWSAIPATYTDLVLVVNARSTYAATIDNFSLYFNDGSVGPNSRNLKGDGASATSATFTNNASTGFVPGSTVTANTFGNTIITIPNYAGSTNKPYSIDSVGENNGSTAYAMIQAALWPSTAAVNIVAIACTNGNFAAGSTLSLYGLTHA
jgi:hypothetical protein